MYLGFSEVRFFRFFDFVSLALCTQYSKEICDNYVIFVGNYVIFIFFLHTMGGVLREKNYFFHKETAEVVHSPHDKKFQLPKSQLPPHKRKEALSTSASHSSNSFSF